MQIDVPATATDPESEIAGPSNSSAVPQGDRSADDRGIQRWIDWTVGGCKGKRMIQRRAVFKCHRAPVDRTSEAAAGKNPPTSKKDVCCPFEVEAITYVDEPDMVYLFEHFGHQGHEPGSPEDMNSQFLTYHACTAGVCICSNNHVLKSVLLAVKAFTVDTCCSTLNLAQNCDERISFLPPIFSAPKQ